MASKVKSDFRAELFLELDVVSPFSLRMSPRALFTLVGSRMPLAILDHIGTQATGIEGLNTAASDQIMHVVWYQNSYLGTEFLKCLHQKYSWSNSQKLHDNYLHCFDTM